MTTFSRYFPYLFFLFTWVSATFGWFTLSTFTASERSMIELLMVTAMLFWSLGLSIYDKLDRK